MNERIKKVRKALDLTQRDFGTRIGTTQNAIANYETGHRNPSSAVIDNICKTFNVNETWLRTGKGEMFAQRPEADEIAAAVERLLTGESTEFKRRLVNALSSLKDEHWLLLEQKLKEIVGMRDAASLGAADQRVPAREAEEKVIRYSVPGYSLPMSAGTGQEAGEEYPENYTLVKEPPRGTSFIAPVRGDSMEPTYRDGDLVFVHAAEEIPVGKIGAFHMDGQQWVKELGDGELISHNPAYTPRPMTEDIRCQGLVLGVCDESYFE